MKHIILIVFAAGLSFLIFGCSHQKETADSGLTFHIDLTKEYAQKPLVLSALSEDMRMIHLETNEHSLLKWFQGHVGDNFIIALQQEKMVLFTGDGQYIRTIAKRGKGPLEFQQVDAWAVDQKEEFFYYHDIKKDYVYKYKLATGDHEKLPFEDKGYLSQMIIVNDTTFALLPDRFANYGYDYFYQTHSGRILEGNRKEQEKHPGAWAGMSPVFKESGHAAIVFQPSESDTIYQIEGAQMRPIGSISVEEPLKQGDKTIGHSAVLSYLDHQLVIIQKSGFEKRITENSSSMNLTKTTHYLYDRQKGLMMGSGSFEYHFNGAVLVNQYVNFPQKRQFVAQFQPIDIKSELERALQDEKCTDEQKRCLKALNAQILEDDNPILITGSIK